MQYYIQETHAKRSNNICMISIKNKPSKGNNEGHATQVAGNIS